MCPAENRRIDGNSLHALTHANACTTVFHFALYTDLIALDARPISDDPQAALSALILGLRRSVRRCVGLNISAIQIH